MLSIFNNNPEIKNLYIVSKDVEHAFEKFSSLYYLIEAAGGFVRTSDQKILVILRRGKWDLPKGKLNKNELPETGAIREVEEECGINELEILKLLEVTYHTYKLEDKEILKRTYWYEMFHSGNKKLKPETEEDITEAKWIKPDEVSEISLNTYPSILEVFKKTVNF